MKDCSTGIIKLSFGEILTEINALDGDTILLVADQKVWRLYQENFPLDEIKKFKKVILWIAPEGENSKNYKSFGDCMEYFLSRGVHRNAHLIALGGGATSDFAGFVASAILRGIPWSVIPTTLLSMVDAAIGGKVAINSKYGKNLIGAFHLPRNIWINYNFLKSLGSRELKSGQGEIIKYACLDEEIFKMIINGEGLENVIMSCAKLKSELVKKDFCENGPRKILNLGHTFGHAFEKMLDLPHGVAVVEGIDFLLEIFNQVELASRLVSLRESLKWESETSVKRKDIDLNTLLQYVHKDKKTISKESIELIVLDDIGRPKVRKFSFDDLKQIISERYHG